MFNKLTLKQRVMIQLVLNITLQIVVVTGVVMDWDKFTLVVLSIGIGAFMLWLYLDSAMASGQFVTELISGAQRMGQGDLTSDVATNFGNPTLREGLGTMQALQLRMRSMIGSLNEGAFQVSNAAREIADGNHDLSRRTEMGSADLQVASNAMKQTTETASQSSDAMQRASALSKSTCDLVRTSGNVVGQAVGAMDEVSKSSHKISDIISVIDGIAFQTNILALNAAVEAARAGEQGRGFAVVASEVRILAGRSAAAAKEIKDLITTSVDQVENGSLLVNQAGEQMNQVVKAISDVSDLIIEAEGMSRRQTQGLQGIAVTLETLDTAMQQNAALVEQGAAAAESLKSQAEKLQYLVEEFKLPSDAASNYRHPVRLQTTRPTSISKTLAKSRSAIAPAAPKIHAKKLALARSPATKAAGEWESF